MQPIRHAFCPLVMALVLSAPAVALAEDAAPAAAPLAERVTDDDEAPAADPAAAPPAEPVAPPLEPAAAPAPEAVTTSDPSSAPGAPSEPEPTEATGSEPFFRRVMMETAAQERRQRYGEALLGLTAAGALFGTGFAAQGDDMTASHWIWVASGVATIGGITSFFIPSPFEHFVSESAGKSDAALRARWEKIAEHARKERRVGAVLGTLVGGAAIALGVLTLEDQVWNLSNDARLIVGTGMITGGAFGVTKGVVDWFVPTTVERAYALVAPPKMALSLSGAPQGFGLGVKGVFQ